MSATGLESRRDFLRRTQNADGGWGYFPGKQSWLEPSAWATLALLNDAPSSAAVQRALTLIRSWQSPEGWWRASAPVNEPSWATTLALTLCTACGEFGSPFERGVAYVMQTAGAESSRLNRIVRWFRPSTVERDVRWKGWPWRPDTSAWVEPTAHALVALKKAAHRFPGDAIRQRIDSGERMLLAVRCPDGGWNYGSPRALGVDLPSYPETTAVALVGLQNRAPQDAVDQARKHHQTAAPGLASAWLTISLRLNAVEAPERPAGDPGPDILLNALEALGAPDGNWPLLRAEAK